MKIQIQVDGKHVEVQQGISVLKACLINGIYIPHLCFFESSPHPHASCRLCFVDVDGEPLPVTACTYIVKDRLGIQTNTERVRQLQRSAFTLLLSMHEVNCKSCHANKRCELQKIAKFLNTALKQKTYPTYLKPISIDQNHPCITYYPNRCVLCGRCVQSCQYSVFSFAQRGFETTITTFGNRDVTEQHCENCRRCVEVCPVGALLMNSHQHQNQINGGNSNEMSI
ncbi:MAG: (2Fe-2S)-binding protein [Desulfobacterales bacterium]|nr:(2Fe-2S)-binding protein [Desulfobacterales bacterium]